jgi:hypothetical protein
MPASCNQVVMSVTGARWGRIKEAEEVCIDFGKKR